MRILTTTMLVIAAGAAPAYAEAGQPYLEVDFGVLLLDDMQLNNVTGVSNIRRDLQSGPGLDAALIFGYDTGPVRLELEGSAKRGYIDQITRTKSNTVTGLSNTTTFDATGHASAYSVMANALVDIGDDDGLQGYVGGGVGYSWVDTDLGTSTKVLDDRDGSFAWQALAGLRLPVSDKLDLGLKYRFFKTRTLNLVTPADQQVNPKWRSHSLMATLAYNLGGGGDDLPVLSVPYTVPQMPYTQPSPAAPPKVPPVQTCNTGPYVVFFDWDKSVLTETAKIALDSAVSQYAWCGNARVLLSGHADRSGQAGYNVALSMRRNAAVRNYLATRGIADEAIASEAYGEGSPRVATQDGVREPQNRRVEVNFGPGSGN
jgi:OmpA-OmpF porin, OOP family